MYNSYYSLVECDISVKRIYVKNVLDFDTKNIMFVLHWNTWH